MPRLISSASGSASSVADIGGALAREAIEVVLDLQRVLQHGERVAVDVEMVVGALLDSLQRLQLGQDDSGHAQLVEQGEAAQRVGAADELAQLGELALAGGLAGAAGFGAGKLERAGVDRQVQLRGQAGGAQQAQRVRGEAAFADRAEEAALEVGQAAVGIERSRLLRAGPRWHPP